MMGKPEWEKGRAAQMWRERQANAMAWRLWAERESAGAERQTIELTRDDYAQVKKRG